MSKKKPKNYEIKNIDFGNVVTLVIENFRDNKLHNFIASIKHGSCGSYIEYDLSKTKTIVGKKTVLPVKFNGINLDKDDNLYFIFDCFSKLRYVGIKDDSKAHLRLNDHLVDSNLSSKYKTCLEFVINYIEIEKKNKLYILTTKVTPEYMLKSVEKYFIESFWLKQEAQWNSKG